MPATVALFVIVLATGAAAGAARPPSALDPSFGDGGRIEVSLPPAFGEGSFGPIAASADGHLFVGYRVEPKERAWFGAIGELEANGAPDPAFAEGGWAGAKNGVSALAADPAGGVIYADEGTLLRRGPDGVPDDAFDARSARQPAAVESIKNIVIDPEGRILIIGTNPQGPRFHPHEGETEVMRFARDGAPDLGFGTKGVVYLGQSAEGGGLGLQPDASVVVGGEPPLLVSEDGTVSAETKAFGGGKASALAAFPDGSFAVAGSRYREPGCTVTRYEADGSVATGFGEDGVFSDPRLYGCGVTPSPEGGLLIDGAAGAEGEGPAELVLLNAVGAPALGFGDGGSLLASAPGKSGAAALLKIESVLVRPDGRIVIAGRDGAGEAVLVGLTTNGAIDSGFGTGGAVTEPGALPSWTRPRAAAALPDGELIVTGMTDSGGTEEAPFWMRFDADGRLRPTSSGAAFAPAAALGTQLIAAGPRYLYSLVSDHGPRIVKLARDGSLVEGFGRGGMVGMPHGFAPSSFVVDPDGGVTVLGSAREGRRMAAYRITVAGRPDRGFGRRGLATLPVLGAGGSRALGGALRPDGDILVAGSSQKHLVLAEISPDGWLRRGFGHAGFLDCRCGGARPKKIDLVIRRGDAYLLDQWKAYFHEGVSLVKVDAGGRIDRSFAGRGYRLADVGSAIGLFAEGRRLLVVGQPGYAQGASQVRAFGLDGVADRSFHAGASVIAGEFVGSGRLAAVMQPDGRLVIVGQDPGATEAAPTPVALIGLR